MLQSLRARLAFLFAGTLVLATVIAAVVVVSLYQSYNRDQTVTQLRDQVDAAFSATTRGCFDQSRTGKARRHQVIAIQDASQTVTASLVSSTPAHRSSAGRRRTSASAGIQRRHSRHERTAQSTRFS